MPLFPFPKTAPQINLNSFYNGTWCFGDGVFFLRFLFNFLHQTKEKRAHWYVEHTACIAPIQGPQGAS